MGYLIISDDVYLCFRLQAETRDNIINVQLLFIFIGVITGVLGNTVNIVQGILFYFHITCPKLVNVQ